MATKNLFTLAEFYLANGTAFEELKLTWKANELTYNRLCNISNEAKINDKLLNIKTVCFNRYNVIHNQKELFNKKEAIDKLNSHVFCFKLQGISLSVSVDNTNNLMFGNKYSLAYFYLNNELTLKQCNYITNYIEKELKDNIVCSDKEIFFNKRTDAYDLVKSILNDVYSKNLFVKDINREIYLEIMNGNFAGYSYI
jgi:hypothetical protein